MFSKIKTVLSRKSRKTGVKQPLLNKKKKGKSKRKSKSKSKGKTKKSSSSNSPFVMVNMPHELKNGPNNFSKKMMNKGGLEYTYSKNGKKETKLYRASKLPPPLNLTKFS